MVVRGQKEVQVTKLGGEGRGTAHRIDWMPDEALPPNANMVATITLEPGASVSVHAHDGEAEVYRIMSGTGIYSDNGVDTEVGPGDVTVCRSGEQHGLKNAGPQPLVFDAVIIGG